MYLQFDFARLPGNKQSLNCPWKVAPKAIDDRNIAERSTTLLDQYRKKSKLFKTDAVLAILGDDFRYSQVRYKLYCFNFHVGRKIKGQTVGPMDSQEEGC